MAEIAIAAAVAAAVSAAAYTVQYALTPKAKPIEQGRLTGPIHIQDSRYGGMIPILLGGEPASGGVGCDPGPLRTARWTGVDNLTVRADGSLEKTSGSPNTYDAEAYSTRMWPGTRCAEIRFSVTDDKFNRGVFVVIENEDGDVSSQQGFWFGHFVGSRTFRVVQDGVTLAVDNLNVLPNGFRITTDGAGNGLLAFSEDDDGDYSTPISNASFTYDETKNWRVHVIVGDNSDFFYTPPLGVNACAPAVSIGDGSPSTDGTGGGLRVAGNVVYMSDVRKVESVTPAEGGKGFGNKNPDTVNISYFCDLAIMIGEGELGLNKMFADTDVLLALNSASGTTGVRYPAVSPDPDADNILLPAPGDSEISELPTLRFSGESLPDENGTVTGTLTNGADYRFYSGSETQLPDPLLEAHFGVGDTPAYLGRSYIVLENFEVGKYGRIPNFNFIVYNLNLRTAADCIDHLCQRVGLESDEFDVSNVDVFDVRGIPITNREGPGNTIGLIGLLFGFDVVETNGEIVCVERGGAPSFAVAEDDLGTVEDQGDDDPQSADIPELVQNELQLDQTQLPRRTDVNFFDPARDGETNTAGHSRLEAVANGFHTVDVNAVLTYNEGQQLAHRLNDTEWIESGGAIRFKVPHTFAEDITAAAVGTVTRNGITHTVRVKEVNGFIPGVLEAVGIVTRGASYSQTQVTSGEDAGAPLPETTPPGIPATTIATLIDRVLRDRELQDGQPGFYVAACSFGNGSWGGANLYVDRGSGYAFVTRVSEQATMGIVDATDATIAGGSEVDVELYSDQTLPTGQPTWVLQGELIYQYENATQLSTSPNLWRLDTLTEIGARCTSDENGSHAAGERFVVLNQALRYVCVESSEIGQTRDYKAVTIGQDINDAGVISFELTAPNITVTTPSDYALTGSADGSITHNATPFSDACVMLDGLIYEIRADSAGSPGALIYSGNSLPYKEVGLASGSYTRHFRARTKYADGDYEVRSVTLTVTSPPNVDQLARDMAQRALGIAMQARGQGGGGTSTSDDTARDSAQRALELAQRALGIALQARGQVGAQTVSGADVTSTQAFS